MDERYVTCQQCGLLVPDGRSCAWCGMALETRNVAGGVPLYAAGHTGQNWLDGRRALQKLAERYVNEGYGDDD